MKLMHVATVPQMLWFLTGQPTALRADGHHVVAVSSPGPELAAFAEAEGIPAVSVPMTREISPWRDLRALVALVRVMRRHRPDIVHAHTPKGGLLATMAGRLAGVPVCIYQIHGLRFMTARGARRQLLLACERITCLLAHRVLCVSHSVLRAAEEERVIRRGTGVVLGAGTVNGLDLDRFSPRSSAPGGVRSELGIPADSAVIGFVGRIVTDKGIAELQQAWSGLRESFPRTHLVLMGEEESGDPVPPQILDALRRDPQVHLVGYREDVRPWFAEMTVLVLPSHREGFGQVLLEAAAMGVPAVATDIPGIQDAVVSGRTGTLVPLGDVAALEQAIATLLQNEDLRRAYGRAGRERAVELFDSHRVQERLLAYYLEALTGRSSREYAVREN